MAEKLEDLIHYRISRRKMLKNTAFLTAGAILPFRFFESFLPKVNNSSDIFFKPIKPSLADELILPDGYSYHIIRKWGDMISGTEYFGYNNDFVTFLPFKNSDGTLNINDGIMFVNHEYPIPLFISGYTPEDHKAGKIKTEDQILREKRSVGFSIFRINRSGSKWEFVNDEKYNRRIDGLSNIKLSGKAAGSKEVKYAIECTGTVGNCSGGVSPWGTVLSGEENFQDYPDENIYRWNDSKTKLVDEHYGWMVEIDPFDKNSVPKKRTSLGRFRHENISFVISADKRVVAYMGDDKEDECVYKFISTDKFDPFNPASNTDILDNGDLYAADFENNRWIILDIEKNEKLKKEFSSQAEILVNCDRACKTAGATPCNRCEDIEISPADRSVYIAFTNNKPRNDHHGSIIRLIEKNNDHTSVEFRWEVFAAGGVDSGFSCPDNLYFDSKANLWVLCDVASASINKGAYEPFKNNSLFMIPTGGENKGKAFRFAAGPVDTEMCGTCFSPDSSAMFMSIQHPGENTMSPENPTSRWPDFGSELPKPAVVAITGFK